MREFKAYKVQQDLPAKLAQLVILVRRATKDMAQQDLLVKSAPLVTLVILAQRATEEKVQPGLLALD